MKQYCQPLIALLICIMVSACIPARVMNRGHVDAMDRLSQISIGNTTRDEVFDKLGSPSLKNNYGDETWFYINERKEAVAFLKPTIKDQNVTRIVFDTNGLVREVNHYGLKDSRNVAVAKEITPTEGHELGFMEQILGNVGRFNSNDTGRQPNLGRR